MNLFVAVYLALLFVLLTPGILVRLPPKSSALVVAVVHGVIFAIVAGLTVKSVWSATRNIHTGLEGFTDDKKDAKGYATVPGAAAPAPAHAAAPVSAH